MERLNVDAMSDQTIAHAADKLILDAQQMPVRNCVILIDALLYRRLGSMAKMPSRNLMHALLLTQEREPHLVMDIIVIPLFASNTPLGTICSC
jgi:hypothetical protein